MRGAALVVCIAMGVAAFADTPRHSGVVSGGDRPLTRPKFGLIPAANIRDYPHTDTYLDLNDSTVSHYFILTEDYVFQNLDGSSHKIPAGFIWDGASIPKKLGSVGLEVGNTRYNSAIAEGLMHDYMYRNPQQFKKAEADELFYENLKRCNNPNPKKLSAAVKLFGGAAYLGHAYRRITYTYWFDRLPEFYAENLKRYQFSQEEPSPSVKQKAKDTLLGRKTEEQPADLHNLDFDDPNGDWCKCGDQTGCFETPDWVCVQCTKCMKINVKFARLALQREKEWKEAGKEGCWTGNRNDAVKAAGARE